jgi:hypothetical protein
MYGENKPHLINRQSQPLGLCGKFGAVVIDACPYMRHHQGINNTGASMKSLLLAAAAALSLGFSAPAGAELTPIGAVGPWKILADAGLCQAGATYKNGTQLSFFINTKAELWVSVSSDGWVIPAGDYVVETQVDRSQRAKHPAKVIDNWVLWQIAMADHNLNLLSYGRTLYLTVGSQEYQYDLTRSEAMLKALAKCAAERAAAANPFAGSTPPANPFAETASNPYRRM